MNQIMEEIIMVFYFKENKIKWKFELEFILLKMEFLLII